MHFLLSCCVHKLQAYTVEGSHSLHITVSVGQKNSWGDFLEKVNVV